MSDMGPRRSMDGFGRTAAAGPVRRPASDQPAARPVVRPQTPAQPAVRRPSVAPVAARPAAAAPVRRVEREPEADDFVNEVRPKRAKKASKSSNGGWRVILQFVIGLLIIAAVAFAVVALYVRYYQ